MSRAGARVSPARMATYSKSAERADREFGEDIEAIEDRHRRRGELKRVIFLQFAAREADERQAISAP